MKNTKPSIHSYLRAAEFLYRPQPSKRSEACARILPPERLPDLSNLSPIEIHDAVKNPKANAKAYHALCLRLIDLVLRKDGWKTFIVDPAQLEPNNSGAWDEAIPNGVAFLGEKRDRRLLFCFEDLGGRRLKRVADRVARLDGESYRTVCVQIFPADDAMHAARCVECADTWKRGLFLSFPELRRRAMQLLPTDYSRLFSAPPSTAVDIRKIAGIAPVVANIKENVPVGAEGAFYKLRFEARDLRSIIPGQFIMMDTTPLTSQRAPKNKLVSMAEFKKLFAGAPRTFLKRPFSIHRPHFKYFSPDYVRRISLPPLLATMLHTVLPHEFDIVYKVLPSGAGTREMTNLKPGDQVRMIGPLGKRYDLRQLRRGGVKEVHLVGGGVGMAPLIFMIPALKFLGLGVKAFIGVESLDQLLYTDEFAASHADDPQNARIYIDDLIDSGVARKDIFVSFMRDAKIKCNLPQKNMARGFVTDLYQSYLDTRKTKPATAAFSCGPTIMMHKVYGICKERGISLKVLMEKPMGCGIGVCLSCVCTTKDKAGASKFSRVCADGPIFEADDIVWKDELGLK
ncbi:hypothetical protein LLG95_18665 [bacterium]|nr:hypothetical protein [bacterium]